MPIRLRGFTELILKRAAAIFSHLLGSYFDVNLLSRPVEPVGPDLRALGY